MEELLSGQATVLSNLPAALEKDAQRYAARLVIREEAPHPQDLLAPEASPCVEVDTC